MVLDNFAAWDNMFLRDRIRVENRRDPGFASLVQDAIDASSVGPLHAEKSVQLKHRPRLGSCQHRSDDSNLIEFAEAGQS